MMPILWPLLLSGGAYLLKKALEADKPKGQAKLPEEVPEEAKAPKENKPTNQSTARPRSAVIKADQAYDDKIPRETYQAKPLPHPMGSNKPLEGKIWQVLEGGYAVKCGGQSFVMFEYMLPKGKTLSDYKLNNPVKGYLLHGPRGLGFWPHPLDIPQGRYIPVLTKCASAQGLSLVTEAIASWAGGILTAQDLYYQGQTLPPLEAQQFLKALEQEEYLYCRVVGTAKYGHYARLQYHIEDNARSGLLTCAASFAPQVEQGMQVDLLVSSIQGQTVWVHPHGSSVLFTLGKNTLRLAPDKGYIPLSEFATAPQIGDSITATALEEQAEGLFTPVAYSLSGDVLAHHLSSETRLSLLLNDLEQGVLRHKVYKPYTERLLKALEAQPSLNPRDLTTLPTLPLPILYGAKHEAQAQQLGNMLETMTSSYLWIHAYQEQNGKTSLVLYNHEQLTMRLSYDPTLNAFWIGELYLVDEGKGERAAYIRQRNKTNYKIASSSLKLSSRSRLTPYLQQGDRVLNYLESAKDISEILKELRAKIVERRKLYTEECQNLKNYIGAERRDLESCNKSLLYIEQQLAPCDSGEADRLALRLQLDDEQVKRLYLEAEGEIEQLYVELSHKVEFTESITANLEPSEAKEGEYKLIGRIGAQNLGAFASGQFYMRHKVNTKHLQVQEGALSKVIKGKDSILFDELEYGRLQAPSVEPYKDIQFYNPLFDSVPADNRQPEAIRKALDNKNILLIQGPPGTGKTSVIIEIIRQLVREGKRILVCSQANAAVENINTRLRALVADESDQGQQMRIHMLKREGNDEAWGKHYDAAEYLDALRKCRAIALGTSEVLELSQQDEYRQLQQHLRSVRPEIAKLDAKLLGEIYDKLQNDEAYLAARSKDNAQIEHSHVVLGTCISVGLSKALASCSLFDTVIIDEAAKANLAETLVPMQLGKRYILVGDDKQLPPYIDKEQVEGYAEEQDLDASALVRSLSASLFEHFAKQLPKEHIVMLNYQHRMHKDIADCISELFYSGKLNSGDATHHQPLRIADLPQSVSFFDTSKKKHNFERKLGVSYSNRCEVELIRDVILPKIMEARPENKSLEEYLGIITPYRGQIELLKRSLPREYHNSIHTVDSIQGSEYDVVIFSFVRAFASSSANRNPRDEQGLGTTAAGAKGVGAKNVGFVADLRRLNVSLSRAKHKLILVGHSETLRRAESYSHVVQDARFEDLHPREVFERITRYTQEPIALDPKARFVQFLKEQGEGYVLNHCSWESTPSKGERVISFSYHWEELGVDLSFTAKSRYDLTTLPQCINVTYSGIGSSGQPHFDLVGHIPYHLGENYEATMVWHNPAKTGYSKVSLPFGGEAQISVQELGYCPRKSKLQVEVTDLTPSGIIFVKRYKG